jgi:hypothetical protein
MQALRFIRKDKYPLNHKQSPTEASLLQTNPVRFTMRYREILQTAVSFLK